MVIKHLLLSVDVRYGADSGRTGFYMQMHLAAITLDSRTGAVQFWLDRIALLQQPTQLNGNCVTASKGAHGGVDKNEMRGTLAVAE